MNRILAWGYILSGLGLGLGLAAGCSTLQLPALPDLPSAPSLSVYKQDVVQGNVVFREQVQALRVGMSKDQVRNILGSPLLISMFHSDRWDYAFTMQRAGKQIQQRRATVFFQGDAFLKIEGDDMPSEAEFLDAITNTKKSPDKPPKLEASDADLADFAKRGKPNAAPPEPPVVRPAPNKIYPPLEPQ
jgi:outer membrane protein assembly factor BamE